MKRYPLQFEAIIKERIWGGTKLNTYLNKPIYSEIAGESWEISTVDGDVSIIANGPLEGKLLTDIIRENPEAVLGKKVHQQFGSQFPLLFKYLDAREDLSVQVHPNDELAQKRHHSFGKTEMWYVMQADEEARLIVGFKQPSSAEAFRDSVQNKTLLSLLDSKKVKKGDSFFLETGTVHAIGAGTVIAEIQQTSDITYRIYDFDRKDAEGKTRELHIDLALDAINYEVTAAERNYDKEANTPNQIVDCRYFTTNFIPLDGEIEVGKNGDSFTVYMCVDGRFELHHDGQTYVYITGDTVLIPAEMRQYAIEGKASLLEIYIS